MIFTISFVNTSLSPFKKPFVSKRILYPLWVSIIIKPRELNILFISEYSNMLTIFVEEFRIIMLLPKMKSTVKSPTIPYFSYAFFIVFATLIFAIKSIPNKYQTKNWKGYSHKGYVRAYNIINSCPNKGKNGHYMYQYDWKSKGVCPCVPQ